MIIIIIMQLMSFAQGDVYTCGEVITDSGTVIAQVRAGVEVLWQSGSENYPETNPYTMLTTSPFYFRGKTECFFEKPIGEMEKGMCKFCLEWAMLNLLDIHCRNHRSGSILMQNCKLEYSIDPINPPPPPSAQCPAP